MWTPEYYVRLIELPKTVDGTVVPNDDGSFDIYLNALKPEEQRRRWLEHELEHIRNDHFYREAPIAELEAEADGAAPKPRREPVRTDAFPLFPSPEAVIEYYRANPDRIREDYGGCAI